MPDGTGHTIAKRAASVLLDLGALAAFTAIGFVALTGGVRFDSRLGLIRLTTTGNPTILLWACLAARCAWFAEVPGPFTPWLPLWIARSGRLAACAAESVTRALATRTLVVLLGGSTLLRLWSAWGHPGFITGDDLEVQEMSLSALPGTNWPVWNLRNAFFPMVFVYPFHSRAH